MVLRTNIRYNTHKCIQHVKDTHTQQYVQGARWVERIVKRGCVRVDRAVVNVDLFAQQRPHGVQLFVTRVVARRVQLLVDGGLCVGRRRQQHKVFGGRIAELVIFKPIFVRIADEEAMSTQINEQSTVHTFHTTYQPIITQFC